MKNAACPLCACSKVMIAKQDEGVLLETSDAA
jgi:hypothetical protein